MEKVWSFNTSNGNLEIHDGENLEASVRFEDVPIKGDLEFRHPAEPILGEDGNPKTDKNGVKLFHPRVLKYPPLNQNNAAELREKALYDLKNPAPPKEESTEDESQN